MSTIAVLYIAENYDDFDRDSISDDSVFYKLMPDELSSLGRLLLGEDFDGDVDFVSDGEDAEEFSAVLPNSVLQSLSQLPLPRIDGLAQEWLDDGSACYSDFDNVVRLLTKLTSLAREAAITNRQLFVRFGF